MFNYSAFGLELSSEFQLFQLKQHEIKTEPDVRIISVTLSEKEVPSDGVHIENCMITFCVENLARFRITCGNLIEVSPFGYPDFSQISVYIMGSCMGAVLHQRGELPMHGSCVTDGSRAILFTGDSGAGKSTLASVFLTHGWKLMTDDVSLIRDPEGTPMVQPSYPSQKLWESSPEMKRHAEEDIHSLYERDGELKFGVSAEKTFCSVMKPLAMIVRLIVSDQPTAIRKMDEFTAIDQIMGNTYRPYMIMRDKLERHFQCCVTMACRIPVFATVRNIGSDSREELYRLITDEYNKIEKSKEE